MGITKGYRVAKKAASEFKNFVPNPVSDKIKAAPKVQKLFNQIAQPLQPLKYKLQDLPTPDNTFNQPLGNTDNLPFQIMRTWTGNVPVYTDFKNNRQRELTVVRRIYGDVEEFVQELSKVVSNAPIEQKVGRVEIKGLHKDVVDIWLRRLGFQQILRYMSHQVPWRLIYNQRLLKRTYKLQGQIGSGGYSYVGRALNVQTGQAVAVKIGINDPSFQFLQNELAVMQELQSQRGFPVLIDYGWIGKIMYIVMQLLGNSLEDCLIMTKRPFSLKTIIQLGRHMISRIRAMHKKGILHLDIKPNNFVFGNRKKNQNVLYLIDFGNSKNHNDQSRTRTYENIIGTLRYLSIKGHSGYELSYSDDLESMLYTLIYLYRGELPWQGCSHMKYTYRNTFILKRKLSITSEELCHSLPQQFVEISDYIRSLTFGAIPNYSYIANLFKKMAHQQNIKINEIYDWHESEFQSSEPTRHHARCQSAVRERSKGDQKTRILNVQGPLIDAEMIQRLRYKGN